VTLTFIDETDIYLLVLIWYRPMNFLLEAAGLFILNVFIYLIDFDGFTHLVCVSSSLIFNFCFICFYFILFLIDMSV